MCSHCPYKMVRIRHSLPHQGRCGTPTLGENLIRQSSSRLSPRELARASARYKEKASPLKQKMDWCLLGPITASSVRLSRNTDIISQSFSIQHSVLCPAI